MNIAHSSESTEWYTPSHIIDDVCAVLGDIDFDPCSSEEAQKTVQAKDWASDSLDDPAPWRGRLYVNPPGGRTPNNKSMAGLFWRRLMNEWLAGNVRSAVWFAFNLQQLSVLQNYHAFVPQNFTICVARKRIPFIRDGVLRKRPPGACAFFYIGDDATKFSQVFCKYGAVRL